MLHNFQKIKQWAFLYEKEIFIGLLVIFSSTLSYGLGRLTKLQENQPPVTITSVGTTTTKTIQIIDEEISSDTRIVASKNGTKYYFPWCGSSKTIKLKNKIYFETAEKAELAGYTRAGNCQPKP